MILVIEKQKSVSESLLEMFNFMGIPSHGVDTAMGLCQIGGAYRAAIVAYPERIPDTEDYIAALRRSAHSTPIFAIGELDGGLYELFDGAYAPGTMAPEIIRKISAYCIGHGLSPLGDYRLFGLDASLKTGGTFYLGEEMTLTKTEKLILRYLITTYPEPQAPMEILKHAFRTARSPLLTSVRTHIHQINKKLSQISGAPKIDGVNGGYRLECSTAEQKAEAVLLSVNR